jgi:general L-amino acid transport system permease protein
VALTAGDPPLPAPSRLRLLLYHPRVRSIVLQAVVLIAVVAAMAWVVANTVDNLHRSNIASGFAFLGRRANFDIGQSLIAFTSDDTIARAFLVGVLNTLLVAVLGIVFATVIGVAVGLARLSPNWLLARLGTVYVETLRNVPLLLLLLFMYKAVLSVLPSPRQAYFLPLGMNLSNRGFMVPAPVFGPGFTATAVTLLVAVVASLAVWLWARRRRIETGATFPTGWVVAALVVLPAALVFAATGAPLSFDVPTLQGFNFVGGVDLKPELVALLVGLSAYTAAFIAEVVRAGILSVPHGQTEAARALGLKPGQTLRLIVLPLAIRVIVPPLTNQYLNLTKNSTLAVAIGYPDFFAVFAGSVMQRTGQAVEVIFITMMFYLAVSLATAVLMNWFNRAVAIKER